MCGLKSSKIKNQEESREHARILTAVRAFSNTYQMVTVDESIEYDSNARKWTVRVKPCCEDELYRLELMVHNPENCCRIRAKRMTGDHLMPYMSINEKDKVICFVYGSQGNVRKFVNDRKLCSSKDREMFLFHVLTDVVAGVVELDLHGRCHSQLTWENVEVVEDPDHPQVYHGKLSALEYVVHKSQMKPDKLASLPHLPPEVLKCKLFSYKVDLCKAQTYILGSLMLELLTDKHMSGVRFQQPASDMTTSTAYDNIKENHQQLNTLMISTRLSNNFQTVLQMMLEFKPDRRCSLKDALDYLAASQQPVTGSTSNRWATPTTVTITTDDNTEPTLSTTRLDTTSLITEDRSVEYYSDDKGVYVNGVPVTDMTSQPTKLNATTSTKTVGNTTVTRTTSKTTELDGNQTCKAVDCTQCGTKSISRAVPDPQCGTKSISRAVPDTQCGTKSTSRAVADTQCGSKSISKAFPDRPLSRWSSRQSRDVGTSTKADHWVPVSLPSPPKSKGNAMGRGASAKAPLKDCDHHSNCSASTKNAADDPQEWYYNLDISYTKLPTTTSDVSTSNLF